ncbi:hypothetical protein AAC387_Pa03g1552 [Persea americana]
MAESVDAILDFLRRNQFKRAEAALRGELGSRPDLNGSISELVSDEKASGTLLEEGKEHRMTVKHTGIGVGSRSSEVSKELIVKEVECGTVGNVSGCILKTGPSEKRSVAVGQGLEITNSGDVLAWNFDSGNRNPLLNDGGSGTNNFQKLQLSGQPKSQSVPFSEKMDSAGFSNAGESYGTESDLFGEKKLSWVGSTSKSKEGLTYERHETRDRNENNQDFKLVSSSTKDQSVDNPWSASAGSMQLSSDTGKERSVVKTIFPFCVVNATSGPDCLLNSGDSRKEGSNSAMVELKEQVDAVGRTLFLGNSQGHLEQKNVGSFDLPHVTENNRKEEFPRLPPVRLKSEDKSANSHWEAKVDNHGSGMKMTSLDKAFMIGSFLDVPVGQEISSGGKRLVGSSWLSVSQGIAEDTSDLVSGFATAGDGLSESVDYPNEYWDSDEYEDDDDVGYMRQPIEDEAWFLAHEIDYPSDNEKGTGHTSVPDPKEIGPTKADDDEQSFAEDDSYFSGEQYFQAKIIDQVAPSEDPMGLSMTKMYRRTDENDLIAQYDGQLMDEEELNLMRAEPVWQGFVTQTNELLMIGNGGVLDECERSQPVDLCMEEDQHGSVRSIGVGINSDVADIGSEIRESLVGGSSEGDLDYFCDHDGGVSGSRFPQHETSKSCLERPNKDKIRTSNQDAQKYVAGPEKGALGLSFDDSGFSFPPPLRSGVGVHADSNKALGEETSDYGNGLMVSDDMLAPWRQKGSDSSPVNSSRDENIVNAVRSNSSGSTLSNYDNTEREHAKNDQDESTSEAREGPLTTLEDEEAAAVQEQVRQIKAQEDEFETFNLKIVHRKNRTGFEEDKNFHVVLNSVIAGRYHVTEYLGSAAFSKAIQAHDLHTGMDVCVKIIKNNKDFFDQSLDEIKLLKFVNKNDPADKYHILRLYDYFYYREHLLIVCELLKANLYEFQKFNRESGGEVYFTMPRLQSITIQCLEALQFLHGLGLIHCDLKPENILVKSYSRCEVKVIDLGSSCFQTDHLCSYVQSRSYRAPEVILGLPYDKKIDIWSLGCILAELCTGNVLFQNDSPATLLARVIGIIGSIEQGMLAKGRDTYKYFTKNHMLYERNQDTNRLEYLIPKKTSLRHRLPMGDQGFIDFVAHLLEINPKKRPTASEALQHPWLSYPYEPISS